MMKILFSSIVILIIWPFLFLSQGCRFENKDNTGVTVTIEPVKYFIDRLTSQKIKVNVMVPVGASPATYSPAPDQLMQLSSSKLYVKVGHLGFEEAWMPRMEELNPEMDVVNLSRNVSLIRGGEYVHGDHVHYGGSDPHIWTSPAVVMTFLPDLKKGLITSFPEHRVLIEENYTALLQDVKEMHNAFSDLASRVVHKKFMIFHPALTYLARDYGLEQISIEYEGKEPSPKKLRELIDVANDENIRLILIQKEFDRRNAEMVKEATGAELRTINPLSYDWVEEMQKIHDLFETFLVAEL